MAKKKQKKSGGGKQYDALRPVAPKKLKRQAVNTMNKVYASGEKDLDQREERINALGEKRRLDNVYYSDWLRNQTDQLNAHALAADQSLRTDQDNIHARNTEAYAGMRTQMLNEAGQQVQTVSNPQQAHAFDVSNEQRQGLENIANERLRTSAQLNTADKTRQTVSASNFAMMAAHEANRVANMWEGLKDVANNRDKLRLEKAASGAKEVARLLDKEVSKAQIRGELKGQAAQMGLDQRKLNETVRSNKAGEAQAKSDAKGKGKGTGNKKDEVGQRQKKQESRKVTQVINSAISFISQNPKIQQKLASDPAGAAADLRNAGYSPLYATAAIELASQSRLSSGTKKRLQAQGYIIPNVWR